MSAWFENLFGAENGPMAMWTTVVVVALIALFLLFLIHGFN